MARHSIAAALLFSVLSIGVVSAEEIAGQVVGINPSTRSILLEGGIPLALPEGAKITINGRPGWFDQLKVGAEVAAAVEARDGKYAVSRLDATDPVAARPGDVQIEAAAVDGRFPLTKSLAGMPPHGAAHA